MGYHPWQELRDMKSTNLFKYLWAALAMLMLATPSSAYDLRIHDAPDWVNDGSVFTIVKSHRYFYGVGSSPVMGDPELSKAISSSRARSELKRLIGQWVDAALNDYRSTGRAMDDAKVKSQLKALQKQVTENRAVSARWKDPRTGSLYSLMLLDLITLKEAVKQSPDLDTSLRKHLTILGNTIFYKLYKKSRR
jgi:hypothetical protein